MKKEIVSGLLAAILFIVLKTLGFDRTERFFISAAVICIGVFVLPLLKRKPKQIQSLPNPPINNLNAQSNSANNIINSTLFCCFDVQNFYNEIHDGVETAPIETQERVYVQNDKDRTVVISIGPASYNLEDPRRTCIMIELDRFYAGLERQIYNLMNNRAGESVVYDSNISSFWDVNTGRACFCLIINSALQKSVIKYRFLLNYLELANLRDAVRGYIWYLQNPTYNNIFESNAKNIPPQQQSNVNYQENVAFQIPETPIAVQSLSPHDSIPARNNNKKYIAIAIAIIAVGFLTLNSTSKEEEISDETQDNVYIPSYTVENKTIQYFGAIRIDSRYSDYPNLFNIEHRIDEPNSNDNVIILLDESTRKEGQSDKIAGIQVGNIQYYFDETTKKFLCADAKFFFDSNAKKVMISYYSDSPVNYVVYNINKLDSYLQNLIEYFDKCYGAHIKTTYQGIKGKTDATYRWQLPNNIATLRIYRTTEDEASFDSVSIKIELVCL